MSVGAVTVAHAEPMPFCAASNEQQSSAATELPGWCAAPEPVNGSERERLAAERLDARPLICPSYPPGGPGTKGWFLPEEITEIGAFGRFRPDPAGNATFCVTSFPAKDLRIAYGCLHEFGAQGTPQGIEVTPANDSYAERARAALLEAEAWLAGHLPWFGSVFDWSAMCGLLEPLGTRYGFTPIEFINAFLGAMNDCGGGNAPACAVLCPACGSDWACLGTVEATSGEILTVEGARTATLAKPPTTVADADRLRARMDDTVTDPAIAMNAATCLARADAVTAQVDALPIAAELACTTDRPSAAFCDHWAFGWALYELAFQGDRLPDWLAQPVEAGGTILKGASYAATVSDHIGWETTVTTTRIFEHGQLVRVLPDRVTDAPYVVREFGLPQGEFGAAISDLQHRLRWAGRLKDLLQTTIALQRFDAAARTFDAAGYPVCAKKARDVFEGVIAFYAQPVWQTVQGTAQKSLFETLLVGGWLAVPAVGFVWLGFDLLDAAIIAVRSEHAANIQRVLRGVVVDDVATWPADRCGDVALACADVERDAMLLQMSAYADFVIGRWMGSIYGKWLLKGVATTTDTLGTLRVELEKNDYTRGLAQWLLGGFDEHADDAYEQQRAAWNAMEESGETLLDTIPPPLYLPTVVTDHIAVAVSAGK